MAAMWACAVLGKTTQARNGQRVGPIYEPPGRPEGSRRSRRPGLQHLPLSFLEPRGKKQRIDVTLYDAARIEGYLGCLDRRIR